jgi:putative endonuclease
MVTPNVLRPIEQWRDPRHRRGVAGELAAARFLAARGWAVLAHRYRLGHHDLDLVVRRADVVAFVEVKTRRSDGFGDAREAVGWRKRLVLEMVASAWIARHGRPRDRYRFDLVGVVWSGQGFPQVFHIEDAWRCVRK